METELEGGSTRDTCRQIVYTTWQQETSEISSKKKKNHTWNTQHTIGREMWKCSFWIVCMCAYDCVNLGQYI